MQISNINISTILMAILFATLHFNLCALGTIGTIEPIKPEADTKKYFMNTQDREKSSVLSEIIIKAEFRDINIMDSANSVTVIDTRDFERRDAEHIEQVLNLAPNVNFSSGSSRGKFFQIRGIGERSQFVEPINPSVGLYIDGIDFSGLGGAATTLDIKQIEIFKGPQGTSYGANAMAGLIDMRSNDPSKKFQGSIDSSIGEYEKRIVSTTLSGPITSDLGYRFSMQRSKRDGYTDNDFLGRDDTNGIDEQTLRLKLNLQAYEYLNFSFSGLYFDADNGYDAFSLDNTRNTLSDQPGHDRQETIAFSLESTWTKNKEFDVISLFSHSSSDLEYGFDEDWSYNSICSDYSCGYDAYESFDNYIREKKTTTIDFRLLSKAESLIFSGSTDWVTGIYFKDQEESLLREWTFDADFESVFDTKNFAIYGQLGTQLNDKLRLTSGLRLEYRQGAYSGSSSFNYDTGERLWGGKIGLEYLMTDDIMIYSLVSRGYKAGGVNSSSSLDLKNRSFDTEYLWNYETGIKADWLDGTLNSQLAIFYQDRRKMQVKQSLVDCSGQGACTFTDYIENAKKGANYGAEMEFRWIALNDVDLYGSLGLLRATFKDYKSYSHVDVDKYAANPSPKDLSGHKQAYAPSYQFAFGADIYLTNNITMGIELEGKEEFSLSPRHNARSNRYELLNSHLNYRFGKWSFSLWGRNLNDRDVIVRGFGAFGNDPRKNYALEPYYQYGEPRVIGATAKYSL
jgi:outer membrane receptor protein involved in Fe transport